MDSGSNLLIERQAHLKEGPTLGSVVGRHRSPVQLYQNLDDGKAQPTAASGSRARGLSTRAIGSSVSADPAILTVCLQPMNGPGGIYVDLGKFTLCKTDPSVNNRLS